MKYKKYISNFFEIKDVNRRLFFSVLSLSSCIVVFFLLLIYFINNRLIVIAPSIIPAPFSTKNNVVSSSTLAFHTQAILNSFFSFNNADDYSQKMELLVNFIDPVLRQYVINDIKSNLVFVSKYDIAQIAEFPLSKMEVDLPRMQVLAKGDLHFFSKGVYSKTLRDVELIVEYKLGAGRELLIQRISKRKEDRKEK